MILKHIPVGKSTTYIAEKASFPLSFWIALFICCCSRNTPPLDWAGVVAHRDRDGVKEGPGTRPGLMGDDSLASVSPAGLDEGGEPPGTLASPLAVAVTVESACCSSMR